MIIQNADLSLNLGFMTFKAHERVESLRYWQNKDNVRQYQEKVSIAKKSVSDEGDINLSKEDRIKILVIKTLFKKLTGRDIHIPVIKLDNEVDVKLDIKVNNNLANGFGFGLVYRSEESFYERQELNFRATGYIEIDNNQRINIDYKIDISTEFMHSSRIEIRMGDAEIIDPIVLNLGEGTLSLKDQTFKFDLNGDSNLEKVSLLNDNFAFLAIDKNNDGRINNGYELFGPKTGNGMQELKQYDEDNNDWIDERDNVFRKLLLWVPDVNGEGDIFSLADKGVGAIYLKSLESSFNIKNQSNENKGILKYMGIYVKENGSVGNVGQVDLIA